MPSGYFYCARYTHMGLIVDTMFNIVRGICVGGNALSILSDSGSIEHANISS